MRQIYYILIQLKSHAYSIFVANFYSNISQLVNKLTRNGKTQFYGKDASRLCRKIRFILSILGLILWHMHVTLTAFQSTQDHFKELSTQFSRELALMGYKDLLTLLINNMKVMPIIYFQVYSKKPSNIKNFKSVKYYCRRKFK